MSKIICDVCGTSFPETATQCPICGCVRSGEPVTVAGDTYDNETKETTAYTRVKGGRFSKANVKKRNSGKPIYSADPVQNKARDSELTSEKKNEKGLVIAIIVLLLAITAVVIYIACMFFDIKLPFVNNGTSNTAPNTNLQTQQTTDTATDTTVQTEANVPCESLELTDTVIEFDKAGAVFLLNVNVLPKDTTDEIFFESDNNDVATVDANGKVVAVGAGQALITVTCGDNTTECRVVSNIPEETTVPEVQYTADDFKFYNSSAAVKDLSFPLSDKSFKLYTGEIPAELITWESDNEKVAVFVDGLLTFVGAGVANVKVTYEDMVYECIIRVY